jgi:hypothetical protein
VAFGVVAVVPMASNRTPWPTAVASDSSIDTGAVASESPGSAWAPDAVVFDVDPPTGEVEVALAIGPQPQGEV